MAETPIKRGTARRLGLDLPPTTITYDVTPSVERLAEAARGMQRRLQMAAKTGSFPPLLWAMGGEVRHG